ncbi:MAG TPA: DinB family protein [Planctomycetota bacterium]|mgnify:CR=1 FL=1|nr:DinB family protein [Planctomycetota bacterium]
MTAVPPQAGEYPEPIQRFIDLVPAGDILRTLHEQGTETAAYLRSLSEDLGWARPADDRWSLRELVGHMLDTERVMVAAALHFGRGHECDMPGLNAQGWVDASEYDDRTLADLCNEFEPLRAANVQMFGCLDTPDWLRTGTVDGAPYTPRGIAWFLAGHTNYHMGVARAEYA